jgi:lysozyme family protein
MASFDKYLPLLMQVEGGYQNNPNDKGNYNSKGELVGTQYGVSARWYETVLGRPPKVSDMKAISQQYATSLYQRYFWDAKKASAINDQAVANTVIDHDVNAGNGIKLAQRTLNNHFGYNLSEDGIMGSNTLNALNSVDPQKFVFHYNFSRAEYYKGLKNKTFTKGWLKRLESFAGNYKTSSNILLIASLIGAGYYAFKHLK